MKIIGYRIFAFFFYVFRIFGIKKNKVYCIMTHDDSVESNVGVVVSALKKRKETFEFHYLTKKNKNLGISFFLKQPYHLATSEYILQDNIFLPMAFVKFSDHVKVVQLWHGTGTIKKFGQSANTGKLYELEKRANKTITHLIVNSAYTKKQYKEAFGIPEEKIFITGLPRTDLLFDKEKIEKKKNEFYTKYPELIKKRIILYAPTFRDDEVDEPKIKLDTELLINSIPEDFVLLLRMHPFVARAFRQSNSLHNERIIDMSEFSDVNTLLEISDILITDYSSIVFEFSLLEKPMLFYAYDLQKFITNGRGFYEDYEKYVPGNVFKTTEECIYAILENNHSIQKVIEFKNRSFQFFDGKSTERLMNKIFGSE